MDPLEEVIRGIHAELERRCASGSIGIALHARDKSKFKCPPFVIWEEQGGTDEEPNQTMPDTLLIDVSRVRVTVWGIDDETCRKLSWNLKQAGRAHWGRDIQWIDRSPPVDARESGYLTKGDMIVLNARLSLRIRKTPWKLPHGNEPPTDTVSRQVIDTGITGAAISTDAIADE